MAIQFVGGASSLFEAGPQPATVDLTGLTGGLASAPAEGDLIVLAWARTSNTSRAQAVDSAGWTVLTKAFANDTYDANLIAAYKVADVSPDTSIVFSGSANGNDSHVVAISVWRGVDPTTPMDVAAVIATGTNSRRPNPAAITPVTTGATVLAIGSNACIVTDALVTSGLSDVVSGVAQRATSSYTTALAIGAIHGWTSGAVDPAAITTVTDAATDSWAAYTLALRPATTSAPADATLSATLPAMGGSATALRRGGTAATLAAPAALASTAGLRRAAGSAALAPRRASAASDAMRRAGASAPLSPAPLSGGVAAFRRAGATAGLTAQPVTGLITARRDVLGTMAASLPAAVLAASGFRGAGMALGQIEAVLPPAAGAVSALRRTGAAVGPQMPAASLAGAGYRRAGAAAALAPPPAGLLASAIRRVTGMVIGPLPRLLITASGRAISTGLSVRATYAGLLPTTAFGPSGRRTLTGPSGLRSVEILE